jgi:phage FluMu protein Com
MAGRPSFKKNGYRDIRCAFRGCGHYIGRLYLGMKKTMSKKCPRCHGWNVIYPPKKEIRKGERVIAIRTEWFTADPEAMPQLPD